MTLSRGIGLGLATLVATVGLGQSAAVAGGWWCSSSDPLTVYDDGVASGAAYGHYYNYGDGRAMSTAWFRDLRPGGQDVRVETDFYWYGYNGTECGDAGTCFWFDTSKQTDRYDGSDWYKHARARYLNDSAWRSRGRMDICEIHDWANDPCSAKIIETFDY